MRQTLVHRLYELLSYLRAKQFNDEFHYLHDEVPDRFVQCGLYFFFDQEALSSDGHKRVIRVGKTGNNNNNRLNLHRNGNTDNSVFSKHVGRALAHAIGQPVTVQDIRDYIRPLPYLFIPIIDPQDAGELERRFIEILSNAGQQIKIDPLPHDWLGNQDGPDINTSIRESELWCVHHVWNFHPVDSGVYYSSLELLDHYIQQLP